MDAYWPYCPDAAERPHDEAALFEDDLQVLGDPVANLASLRERCLASTSETLRRVSALIPIGGRPSRPQLGHEDRDAMQRHEANGPSGSRRGDWVQQFDPR
jgi:hypothetical protein